MRPSRTAARATSQCVCVRHSTHAHHLGASDVSARSRASFPCRHGGRAVTHSSACDRSMRHEKVTATSARRRRISLSRTVVGIRRAFSRYGKIHYFRDTQKIKSNTKHTKSERSGCEWNRRTYTHIGTLRDTISVPFGHCQYRCKHTDKIKSRTKTLKN